MSTEQEALAVTMLGPLFSDDAEGSSFIACSSSSSHALLTPSVCPAPRHASLSMLVQFPSRPAPHGGCWWLGATPWVAKGTQGGDGDSLEGTNSTPSGAPLGADDAPRPKHVDSVVHLIALAQPTPVTRGFTAPRLPLLHATTLLAPGHSSLRSPWRPQGTCPHLPLPFPLLSTGRFRLN